MADMTEPADSAAVTCAVCGRMSDPQAEGDPPLTWTADRVATPDGSVTRWACADCTRRHLRSIEGKLDQDWW